VSAPGAAGGAVSDDDTGVQAHAERLLGLAETAIDHGLAHGRPPAFDAGAYPVALLEHRSAFVTLFDTRGVLRGCMGTVVPSRPLAQEVSANAYAAAFKDPRFRPLSLGEREGLSCKLSVLTLPEAVLFADEAEVVAGLRPGIDGVILEGESCRGTFLPAVWEHLPDPAHFWRELKLKAGLEADEWPPDVCVYRYRAVTLG